MSKPVRVQKSRKAGWRTPENTEYVGRARATKQYPYGTKYANPYTVDDHGRQKAVELYQVYILEKYPIEEIQQDLRGRNLMCWCPLDMPCHADFLLRIANQDN